MINVPSLWCYITCSFQSFRHSFTVSSEEYSSPPFVSGDIFSQTTKARWKFRCPTCLWEILETSQINRARNVRIILFPLPAYDLPPDILCKKFHSGTTLTDLTDDPISLFLSFLCSRSLLPFLENPDYDPHRGGEAEDPGGSAGQPWYSPGQRWTVPSHPLVHHRAVCSPAAVGIQDGLWACWEGQTTFPVLSTLITCR